MPRFIPAHAETREFPDAAVIAYCLKKTRQAALAA